MQELYASDDHYTSYINTEVQAINNKDNMKEASLKRYVPDHDCHHIAGEDGCDCDTMTDEEIAAFWKDKMALANPDIII